MADLLKESRHSGESRNPDINAVLVCNWMPAFAGMTSVGDKGFLRKSFFDGKNYLSMQLRL
jgi:hypothetical protein